MKLKSSQVKTILLVCCGQGFNKEYQGHYNRYKVLIDGQAIEKIFSKEELKALAYWVNRSGVMAMTTWGQSQEFEAIISLGYFLGWYDWDNKPDWGEYCRMLEKKIKAIY